MSVTMTIPPQLVPHIREATTHDLGMAASDILKQSERKYPELQEPLRRFDAIRAVLDAMPAEPDTSAQVEQALVPPMVEALREHARQLTGMATTARQEGEIELAAKRKAELDQIEAGLDDLLAREDSDLFEWGA
jgi:hypothetical protein